MLFLGFFRHLSISFKSINAIIDINLKFHVKIEKTGVYLVFGEIHVKLRNFT